MSSSFRRIPVKDMPTRTFRRQIVIAIGAVLIAAAAAFSFWVDTASDMRAAQQRAVHVTGFDYSAMQATRLIYDDGSYTVTYDASSGRPWTVSAHVFPLVTHTY